jgi:hypothetical protein
MTIKTDAGLSSKIKNRIDGKNYILSTAKDPRGEWHLAVCRIVWEIPHIYLKVDALHPIRVASSKTFEEAEWRHLETEDFVTRWPEQLWRNSSFGKETGPAARIDIIAEYLDSIKKSETIQMESVRKIWLSWEGKPNDTTILQEKAIVLAKILTDKISSHIKGFAELENETTGSDAKVKDKNVVLGEVTVEITSIYLSYVNRYIFSNLSKCNLDIFLKYFQTELIESILVRYYKEIADTMQEPLVADINNRLNYYATLPFNENSNGSPIGTLMWEFAENVAKIVGKAKNASFNATIIHTILKDFEILQLHVLLPKETQEHNADGGRLVK